MPLFADPTDKTLEEALGGQANSAINQTRDQYGQARKRLVAQQAHSGRLMSGVSDIPLTDLDTEEAGAESGIHGNLANALAGVPTEDWLNNQEFGRQKDLADQIARLMKPSTLEEVFQGIGAGGRIAASAAASGGGGA